MAQTHDAPDRALNEDQGPTAAEIEAWQRESFFLPPDEATPETHPALYNISAGMMFTGVVRPLDPQLPDYVAIPMDPASLELIARVGTWNMLWEAGQFRRRFFSGDDLPEPIAKIADLGDINTILVPRTRSRYFEYVPLLHLLPKDTLDRFGLPLLRGGQWPFMADHSDADRFLPSGFERRLADAWAWTVWPHLNSGSSLRAFSSDDPIRMISHNLDYWIPPITTVIQGILRQFPEVDQGKSVGPVPLEDGSFLPGAVTGNLRKGGPVWMGKEEAEDLVIATVEAADITGRLRGILDAVRSHRVEDDFSSRWSYAREDFERKLYRKRSKVQVRFVELTDTIPVQGPESEVLGKLVTSDFLALLNEKQHEVVVLLSSGFRQHEIAEKLGYANHSPISKRLAQIQRKAVDFFELDK
ncbi:sigma-70 family RNA polymerase sigma factor [Nocardiopsis sp. Huas11]|uniref:sigma-70 family RNA polymerase sigma factor n=1 Tax=Nocardiopsis sp. Huas11 TaxID=2183912 RepID=UPI000EB26F85|nr:sigma-70 family RNA polymerase sigma factor [Nocardiopsis sp. Huas11]